MITYFLLACLIAVPVYLLFWGISKNGRLLQAPTLAGVAILVLVIPQMVGLCRQGVYVLPGLVLRDHGIQIAILVHFFCYAAFAYGYIAYKNKTPLPPRTPVTPAVVDLIFNFGCVLLAISLFANWKLNQMSGGGLLSFYTSHGGYTLDWHGLPVLYLNISRLAYPAMYCLLIVALSRSGLMPWLLFVLATIYPILTIVLLGRRTAVMVVSMIILIPIQFVRHWSPPKWSVIVMVLGGAVVFYSFTEYRSTNILDGSFRQSAEKLSLDSAQTAFNGDQKKTAEVTGSVDIISAINKTHDFGFGRGIWNATVTLLVPRQVVGQNFKHALLFSWDSNDSAERRYGEGKADYVAMTGPCGAFAEFWYFGALVFFAIGRISRVIWDRAMNNNVVYMLLYVGTIPTFVLVMFNDISQIIGFLAMSVVPVLPLLWWISAANKVTRRPRTRRGMMEKLPQRG